MKKAESLGKIIAAHCEDDSLLSGGFVNEGTYAVKLGLREYPPKVNSGSLSAT
jgi:dihydroorotase